MAWSTPRTWVTGETVTAAIMNAHVRDQLRETSPFTVTTAGDLSYADAASSMNSRLGIGAAGSHLVSTGSAPVWRAVAAGEGDAGHTSVSPGGPTTFTDFTAANWGAGSNVAATVTTGTLALVWFGARTVQHATAGSATSLSFRISGATTVAASGLFVSSESSAANDIHNVGRTNLVTGLTAGSNTFTLQGSVSTDAAAVVTRPYIVVMGL